MAAPGALPAPTVQNCHRLDAVGDVYKRQEYMDYIASDDIVGMSSHYDPKADDYVFSRKERGKR